MYAQRNYQAGIIVTSAGDSLHGFIDVQTWRQNPENIRFKKQLNLEATIYDAHNLSSFLTGAGEKYSAKVVSIDQLPETLDEWSPPGSSPIKMDTVFLTVLVQGPLSLYHYRDEKNHYYIESDQNIVELRFYKRKTFVNGRNVVSNDNLFRQQLAPHLADCPASLDRLDAIVFAERQLANLIADYNACITPGGASYVRKAKSLRFEPGLILGLQRSDLRLTGSPQTTAYPVALNRTFNFDAASAFTAGISLSIRKDKNPQRFSSENILLWTNYSLNLPDPNNEAHISAGYIKMVNMVRLTYGFGFIQPYIQAGFTNAINITYKAEQPTESENLETRILAYITNEEEIRKYEQGITIGLGLELGNIDLGIRQEYANGFALYRRTSTKLNYLFVNLGYTF